MTSSPLPRHLLALSISSLLAPMALAQSTTSGHDHGDHLTELNAVKVTASPLAGDAESLARPVNVLAGEALDAAKGATLGETIGRLPGVHSASFGAGVGRPIIRGQDGPRVQVLNNGLANLDAASLSADHAGSVEPFLADQIEVLKGPATLLFGSGAMGGAVNLADGRIARELPERALSGRAELRGGSVNDERSGMFRLDGVANGNWVVHVDGLVRNTSDVRIPGPAQRAEAGHDDHDDHDDHDTHADHDHAQAFNGRLGNSALSTRAGGVGATWFGDSGYAGLALSTYRSDYGIPPGAHVHGEEGHDHGHDAHDDHDHHDEHEPRVRVDMVSNRAELRAGLTDPVGWLKGVHLRTAWTDYEHHELEDGQAVTRFANQGIETRLEAVQQTINGWDGAFGLQASNTRFRADGAEAFVPGTDTRSAGLFVLQEKRFGQLKLELGARYDHSKLRPHDAQPARDFDAFSASLGGIWTVSPQLDLRFGLDHTERAPAHEELYAAGEHIATGSIEIGNNQLGSERGQRVELGLHAHSDRVEFSAALYHTRFADYIYLAQTGLASHGTPVRAWTQNDATFSGAEAEATFHLAHGHSGDWDLRLFGDIVNAKLDGHGVREVDLDVPHGDHAHQHHAELANSGYLPRIAPARVGADLRWNLGNWRASVGATHHSRQDKVAANEEATAGYTLVNAQLAWRKDGSDGKAWEVFVDGRNLTDRLAREHTSQLRDYSVLPGRGVAFGIRAWF
ncbi:membrane protein [Stenotrophomonas ginsengisoli]|uniref:Membrane protein n=1 Tax=Stenotrophomonas ginsengisoli TaxID=336566 RepID=A0A0R0DGX4_9GAMM|nr:TonB-dependent receptor [Stenotrophomonas ginsengisoli]KRG77345.1 membrane protein [Stenotrophomonas ginsengisoli]